jgi:transposase
MAANSLMASNNWLGDYFGRIKAKGGHKYAIIATARKNRTYLLQNGQVQGRFHSLRL